MSCIPLISASPGLGDDVGVCINDGMDDGICETTDGDDEGSMSCIPLISASPGLGGDVGVCINDGMDDGTCALGLLVGTKRGISLEYCKLIEIESFKSSHGILSVPFNQNDVTNTFNTGMLGSSVHMLISSLPLIISKDVLVDNLASFPIALLTISVIVTVSSSRFWTEAL